MWPDKLVNSSFLWQSIHWLAFFLVLLKKLVNQADNVNPEAVIEESPSLGPACAAKSLFFCYFLQTEFFLTQLSSIPQEQFFIGNIFLDCYSQKHSTEGGSLFTPFINCLINQVHQLTNDLLLWFYSQVTGTSCSSSIQGSKSPSCSVAAFLSAEQTTLQSVFHFCALGEHPSQN